MAPDGFVPTAAELRTSSSAGLVQRLLSAAHGLERRFDDCFSPLGLNLTRAEVLAYVARHGSDGCAQTDLAAALRLSESNICTLIERMRADGWLLRMRSNVDRRKSIVMLSPRGLDVMDELLESRRRQAAELLGALETGQLETLNRLLDAVLDSLAGSVTPSTSTIELRRAS
ncbi:transcriptional repressor MprA [Caulifigura coniformis]|uniref:Transcriptional repressor MprA n=1 Tax=Caulifigura coniformis TaxID=2527983 RepID=A0A517SL63_9PLAN|nr:MarR family winged helix-turn-helix transcriptional regulator [Caulifigura coniformis]QDT56863.1 transcriptional repressor MprA [Caulifigura coniformis]